MNRAKGRATIPDQHAGYHDHHSTSLTVAKPGAGVIYTRPMHPRIRLPAPRGLPDLRHGVRIGGARSNVAAGMEHFHVE